MNNTFNALTEIISCAQNVPLQLYICKTNICGTGSPQLWIDAPNYLIVLSLISKNILFQSMDGE